jgi:hypothetical protein
MMVGVYQAGKQNMAAGIKYLVYRAGRRFSRRQAFADARSVDNKSAGGIIGQNGQRVLDPDSHDFSQLFQAERHYTRYTLSTTQKD